MAELDGHIYAVGGFKPGSGIVGTLEIYDPDTDSWIKGASMPNPRVHSMATVLDGKLYVIGGCFGYYLDDYRNKYPPIGGSALVQVYDPATDSWDTDHTNMPTRRCGGTAESIGDQIYVIGGFCSYHPDYTDSCTGNKGTFDKVEIYDANHDSWTTGTPMPTPLGFTDSALVGDKIHVIGGTDEAVYNGNGGTWYGGDRRAHHYVLATSSGAWDIASSLPEGRAYHSVVHADASLYVIGGAGAKVGYHAQCCVTGSVQEYSLTQDTWTTWTSMPTPRMMLGAAATDPGIIAVGGWDGNENFYTKNEAYTPGPSEGPESDHEPQDSSSDEGNGNDPDGAQGHSGTPDSGSSTQGSSEMRDADDNPEPEQVDLPDLGEGNDFSIPGPGVPSLVLVLVAVGAYCSRRR